MKRFNFIVFSILCSLCFVIPVQAAIEQDRIDQLRKQIEALENEAKLYKGNIAQEQAKAASLQRDISILRNQISSIESEINATAKKIDRTQLEIENLEDDIFDTREKIAKQKSAMSRLVLFLHRRDNENLFATLIKNENISEFFREEEQAANVNTELLRLVHELNEVENSLNQNKENLEHKENELQRLNEENAQKKNNLAGAKGQKDSLLKTTKGQEAQYQKMLADVERRKAEFFTELKVLENKIIAGGLYIVHVSATSVPPRGTKIFKWPEDGYRLTQGYGMTTYARRGAYGGSPHNGVDMASGFGSPIKSIGDGTIAASGFNDGFGNWIAVKHNNGMVSVYGHMSSISFLRVGSQVKVGETIGFEGSTGNSTGSHLHLSLYRDFFTYVKDKNSQLYFNYFDGSVNPLDYM